MEDLLKKKCAPCEGGVPPLSASQYAPYQAQVPEWTVVDGKKIERQFRLKDFAAALAFVNAVGKIAETEGHHPDILIHGWNKVRFSLFTHAIDGLSINDFILAAKIDQAFAENER